MPILGARRGIGSRRTEDRGQRTEDGARSAALSTVHCPLCTPVVILLTGATGNVGSQVLRRLTARGERVRCLVRDPRRLGSERVRVQIALGDLSDPASFRNALRGVETVVHLAAAI